MAFPFFTRRFLNNLFKFGSGDGTVHINANNLMNVEKDIAALVQNNDDVVSPLLPTQAEKDGLDASTTPSTSNPYATIADLTGSAVTTVLPLVNVGTSISTSMNTNRLIGRYSAGVGVMQEILLGTNLALTGNTLNASGGGGVPAGLTTEVQYNNAGAFGANADFTYNLPALRFHAGFGVNDYIEVDGSTPIIVVESSAVGIGRTGGTRIYLDDGIGLINITTVLGVTVTGQVQTDQILITGNNSGAPTAGEVMMIGSTSGTVSIKAGTVITTWALTLPLNDGNAGEVLSTDGTGVSSWIPIPAAPTPSLTATQIAYGDGANLMTSSATFTRTAAKVTITPDGTGTLGGLYITRGDAVNQYIVLHENVASPNSSFLTFKSSGGNAIAMGATFAAGVPTAYIFTDAGGVTLNSIDAVTGANTIVNLAGVGTRMVTASAAGVLSTAAIPVGTVTSVSGTANRISSTGGATPVLDIDAAYVGQSSITTLGTIATGVWQGTDIAVTDGGTGASTALAARANLGFVNIISGSDTTDATTVLVDVTDMVFAIAANENWTFEMSGMMSGTAANGGRLGISFPAGATAVYQAWGNNTTVSNMISNALTTSDQTSSAYCAVATTDLIWTIRGTIKNGGTAGSVKMRTRTVNVANTFKIYAGAKLTAQLAN